jgi:hypothetical protein
MPINKCLICKNSFYARPSLIKKGWGIFCSLNCKKIGTSKKEAVNCYVCGEIIFKTQSQLEHSKSNKFFCSKSCQTRWRNVEYSGKKHSGWNGGQSIYRKKLIRSNLKPECLMCKITDLRVLAVHHIDNDHSNSDLNNLAWLCHNCHYVVHHDKLEKQRFSRLLNF